MLHNSSSSYCSYINNNDPNFFDANTVLSSSLPSNDYFMHRSSSTHSFAHHGLGGFVDPTPNPLFSSSSPSPSACDLLEFHSEPVRRVFSTGDLQASMGWPMQEGAGMAGRVGRYTAEERMKRIERYRSKRNQRNFHKKITYACRKTLADSRPRVRGRFARNGEPETEAEAEVEPKASENGYECYNNHNDHDITSESYTNYNNCGSNYNNHGLNYVSYGSFDNGGGSDTGECWRQMQAPTTTVEDEECCYNEDIWANNFDSFFSMNLLS